MERVFLDAIKGRAPRRVGAAVRRPALDSNFDVAFAGEMARLESYNKHHYRPNSYLHKWWARRCGSTFRLILKHLVEEEAQRDYYAAGGLEGKVVLDPMMGGGTTLHEAIRMGASVVGVDVDPIPVLQARASLSPAPLRSLESAFADFYGALAEALGPLWLVSCPHCAQEEPLRFVLYGVRRACACGPAIVVDSLTLRFEGRRPAFQLCARCHRVLADREQCRCTEAGKPRLVAKQSACGQCGEPFVEASDVPFYARYRPVAIAGQCAQDGLFFTAPGARDLALLAQADARRGAAYEALGDGFRVEPGPKAHDLLRRGVGDYRDLFSSRQLLYLQEARRLLQDEAEPARLNLALLVSTSLEFNSLLCGYKGGPKTARGARPGAIRHTFAHHAYSFPYTALENNMLYAAKSSGTLQKLFHDRLRRARRWAQQPRERRLDGAQASPAARFVPIRGEKDMGTEVAGAGQLREQARAFLVRQGSAAALPLPDGSVDYVVTDPPYYDNVQYSDLSAFFRVWLPKLVGAQPGGCNWRYDLGEVAVDSLHNGNGQYGRVLGDIFAECRRVLKADGRLIFTFHHWKPQSWAALTLALQRAQFRLVNRYVVHAENPISVHVANLRAITDDAILVLAPAEAGVHGSWQRPERVDMSSSEQFCSDCATLLGWLLEQGLADGAVERVWREALGKE